MPELGANSDESKVSESQLGRCTKFRGHSSEVCGLAWDASLHRLASGGNDCKVAIWDLRKGTPESVYLQHKAAVKAISWSPVKRGVLLSGGGARDRMIRE